MNNEKLTEAIESIIDDLQEALYEYHQILENEVALKLKIARLKGKIEELLNTIAYKFSTDVPNLSGLSDEEIDKAMSDFTERIIQGMQDEEDTSFDRGYEQCCEDNGI